MNSGRWTRSKLDLDICLPIQGSLDLGEEFRHQKKKTRGFFVHKHGNSPEVRMYHSAAPRQHLSVMLHTF